MFSAEFAKFIEPQLVRSLSLVLCGPIVFSLTLGTIQADDNTHIYSKLLDNFSDNASTNSAAALANRET